MRRGRGFMSGQPVISHGPQGLELGIRHTLPIRNRNAARAVVESRVQANKEAIMAKYAEVARQVRDTEETGAAVEATNETAEYLRGSRAGALVILGTLGILWVLVAIAGVLKILLGD